jgi:hypothetical protein
VVFTPQRLGSGAKLERVWNMWRVEVVGVWLRVVTTVLAVGLQAWVVDERGRARARAGLGGFMVVWVSGRWRANGVGWMDGSSIYIILYNRNGSHDAVIDVTS